MMIVGLARWRNISPNHQCLIGARATVPRCHFSMEHEDIEETTNVGQSYMRERQNEISDHLEEA